MRISYFWVLRSIWLCKNILNGQMRHEIIYLRLILYLNMKKEIGSPYSSRCTFYRHVFALICYVIHELARTDIYLQRTLIPLLIVIKRWTWYQIVQKKYEEYPVKKNCWGNYFSFGRDERKRAKMRVLRDFLWNAYNGLKRMQKKFKTILSNLKI